MKPQKNLVPLTVLFTVLALWNQSIAQSFIPSSPSLSQPMAAKEAPKEATPDWYAQAVDHLQQMEKAFYEQPKAGVYRVANVSNRLGFFIDPAGYSVHNIRQTEDEKGWQVRFRFLGIGRKSIQWKPSIDHTIDTDPEQLRYIFKPAEVQYTNSNEGLRQNFIIKEKPAGSAPLSIQIQLQGNLQPALVNSSRLAFKATDSASTIRLLYEDLKVWDNNRTPLKASMKLKKDRLVIEVDDHNAAYPITIDPVNKTPDWATTADGLLTNLLDNLQFKSSLYGFTVAGLGDVNGDGFGDVAVSAPAMVDVFSGSGSLLSVGAVFIYYGTASGLSTTPAKRLQPNSTVAGALFGVSIDAGDVTGDGLNDIVVGSPLDKFSINFGLGNKTATVGKVYIFQGGALADPVPSPTLEIKLNTNFLDDGLLGLLLSNYNVTALFGWSVGVTDDLNGDGKKDLIVGCPAFLGKALLSVKAGAAFVYLSNATGFNATPISLEVPSASLLGLASLPILGSSALLYGFSVDGVGDYNGDGHSDVVVGAPAGVDLSSLGGVLNGQALGGSAYVYFGTGSGISSSIGATLHATNTGLLSNALNLFGFKVKGVKDRFGVRNGNIVVGAPFGSLLSNLTGLDIKAGNIHVFKAKTGSINPSTPIISDQVLESPRNNSSILSILSGLNLNLMFGTAIDNAYDVNGDTYPDLVVGEPLSTGLNLLGLQTSVLGGSAYVFTGNGSGGYSSVPFFQVDGTYGSDFLSVNTAAMVGWTVAGAPEIRGPGSKPRIVVGSPGGALDYTGVLNLGATLNTTLGFAAGNNGLGKAYTFDAAASPLPVTLVDFKGALKNTAVELSWNVREEKNLNVYEVQKSADGVNFENIGMVFPWDNNQVENDYAFTDNKAWQGINYYRLRSVDKDGSSKLSKIVVVRLGGRAGGEIVIAPNPVKDRIRVVFSGLAAGQYRIEVRNTAGQLTQYRQTNITQHDQVEFIDRTAANTPGLYWLTVFDKNNQKVSTSRVIIQ